MTRALLLCLLCLGCLALVACGDEETSPPTVGAVTIVCGDAPVGRDADVAVVKRVSAIVEDPDRDIVRITGKLNGLIMDELVGSTTAAGYEWSPPEAWEPLACEGEFAVELSATDQAGNVTTKLVRATGAR